MAGFWNFHNSRLVGHMRDTAATARTPDLSVILLSRAEVTAWDAGDRAAIDREAVGRFTRDPALREISVRFAGWGTPLYTYRRPA